MIELEACFEKQGFGDVVTYIQSGNVLFTSAAQGRVELTRRIEAALARTFDYRASVVVSYLLVREGAALEADLRRRGRAER